MKEDLKAMLPIIREVKGNIHDPSCREILQKS